MLAVHNFHVYMGAHVEMFSDHEPLQCMAKMANHNTRLLRWVLKLANYDIEVRHIKGSDNIMADFREHHG